MLCGFPWFCCLKMEDKNSLTFKDFTYICRLCLNKTDLRPFMDFYALLKLIEDITNIKIENEANLPQNVCTFCIDQVQNISSFINLSKSNDTILRQIINQNLDQNKQELFTEDVSVDSDASNQNQCPEEFDGEIKVKSENRVGDIKFQTTIELKIENKEDIKLTKHSTKSQPANCEICGEYFATRSKLNEHQRKSISCKSKQFRCMHCEKSFFTKFKLKLHIMSHTKETPYECSICFKKFRNSSNLKRHDDAVHKGLKPFKCDICGKEYSRLSSKNEHMYSHSGEHPYVCVYCGKSFRNYSNHFNHISSHKVSSQIQSDEKKDTSELVCKICNKFFSSKSGIRQHLQVHGEKNFLCTICGTSFTRKRQLKEHSRLHTGEKPHVCKNCGKSFRLISGYKSHILTHTGEKPYQCKMCKRSFVQSVHLRKHMRIHTGEKPYKCSFCGKCFAEKCNLKVHTRIHTGETPYHCSVCGIGFYDSSNMKKHEKGHLSLKQDISGKSNCEL